MEPLAEWARIRTPLGVTLGKMYYCVCDVLVDSVGWLRDGSQRTALWSHFSLSIFEFWASVRWAGLCVLAISH